MERGCSHSFVPFQPVCVRFELTNFGQPTRTDNIMARLTFSAGPCSSILGKRYRHVGSDCSGHREQLHTQIYRKASLTEDGANHPSGTVGTNLEVVILPSWLRED